MTTISGTLNRPAGKRWEPVLGWRDSYRKPRQP
jgi:hypothetical protein